jgi:hypothetical protein
VGVGIFLASNTQWTTRDQEKTKSKIPYSSPYEHPIKSPGRGLEGIKEDAAQAGQLALQAGIVAASVLYEPLDWGVTIYGWRQGEFQYLDLLAFLPLVSGWMIKGATKLGNNLDDAVGIAKQGTEEVAGPFGRIDMAGKVHPVTRVPFDAFGFPIFESRFNATIDLSLYPASNYVQFKTATQQLWQAIQRNPALASQFTSQDLVDISRGITPSGYTWHHHQRPGLLQLVDQTIHEKTGHKGGRSIWGGGSEKR